MEILGNTTDAILRRLASLALDEIRLSLSFKDDLDKLRSYLSSISAVLLDAEQRQEKSHVVKDWLRKLKDALNDAKDLLDDLAAQALNQKVEAPFIIVTQVQNFFFCGEMARRIRKITERLHQIDEERSLFDSTHFTMPLNNDQILANRKKISHSVPVTGIIGRENDKKEIIDKLSRDNDESLSVIPIHGIGGLGKTRLAECVFDDDWVEGYFDSRLWIQVSDDLKVECVAKKIIEAISNADFDHLNMHDLRNYLSQTLDAKKFLLVLDDVWIANALEWDTLRRLLKTDVKGSKIIVTTRYKITASIMGGENLLSLASLPFDASWYLFDRWAFLGGGSMKHPNLIKIGAEIVERCGGVPLALRTLGSLLCLNTNETYWLSVKNDESWERAKREDDILPVLKISYDQLPSHLKECFAYCSLLPKGKDFDKETVIQLWMAQGLIHSASGCEQLEDVGSWYFDELVSRSLFDVVQKNHKAEIVKCRMHDLMHDLAKSVAGSECLQVDFHSAGMFESPRHVSFWDSQCLKEDIILSLKASKLRSLLLPVKLGPLSSTILGVFLSDSTYLRILDLSNSGIRYLPNCLGCLKHLRYLNLNGNHDLEYLPDSICGLHFLQTLKLLGCMKINKFPRKFSNLVSLRNLVINSPRMPIWEKQLGSLTSLRSLSIVYCDNLVSLSEGIQHLRALRTLRIQNCGKLTCLANGKENCISLENLEIINCKKISSLEDCLKGLHNLRSLTIKGLPRLPQLDEFAR
ncbi:putative disease resistance protein RGA3 [Prosopis cineraria]|uniref:putative disease resistance protein RGA3 n=1 Tax=Prosopis cineraria TaxID=364024 RepID=UPI00240F916D|nr:putative disease resistance protein RGA3 [Prosopis cineraria]